MRVCGKLRNGVMTNKKFSLNFANFTFLGTRTPILECLFLESEYLEREKSAMAPSR